MVVPDYVASLMDEGGRGNPWITVAQAAAYLPMPKIKAYAACNRYLSRIERERKRRRSYLLPSDVLLARENELPCDRNGRSIMISKVYLLKRLPLMVEKP
jgi:hypothetical protein